jgi:ABC-2 type transport system ATP-binding protein
MAALRPDQAKTGPAGPPRSSAVMVTGLRKSYGTVQAVRGTSFAVEHREIFALLGPNGAGKTTTLEILAGFRTRDAGQVEVLGLDPGDRSHAPNAWARPGGTTSRSPAAVVMTSSPARTSS